MHPYNLKAEGDHDFKALYRVRWVKRSSDVLCSAGSISFTCHSHCAKKALKTALEVLKNNGATEETYWWSLEIVDNKGFVVNRKALGV